MSSLPFLIGKFAFCYLEKRVIIFRCLLVSPQVVVRGCPEKVRDWYLRQELGSCVQSPDGQLILLVFVGCERKIAIRDAIVWLELDRGQKLFLCLGELLLPHVRLSQCIVNLSVVRARSQKGLV